MSIKQAIEELLNKLEEIENEHDEMQDTAVRSHIYQGLRTSSIEVYEVNDKFRMFTKKGDTLMQDAFSQFLNHPEIVKARLNNDAEEQVEKVVKEMNLDPLEDDRGWLLLFTGLLR